MNGEQKQLFSFIEKLIVFRAIHVNQMLLTG